MVGVGCALFLYRAFNRDVVLPLFPVSPYGGVIVRYSNEPVILAGAAIGAVALAALSAYHFIGGGRARALRPA